MFTIKQPSQIIFGKNTVEEFDFPERPLVISSKGCKSRNWLDYLGLKNSILFDSVEPNPSIETVNAIISKFDKSEFDYIIGLGGGSSLDVAKFVGYKTSKKKIMIPANTEAGRARARLCKKFEKSYFFKGDINFKKKSICINILFYFQFEPIN